jgi:hypothetical protein
VSPEGLQIVECIDVVEGVAVVGLRHGPGLAALYIHLTHSALNNNNKTHGKERMKTYGLKQLCEYLNGGELSIEVSEGKEEVNELLAEGIGHGAQLF